MQTHLKFDRFSVSLQSDLKNLKTTLLIGIFTEAKRRLKTVLTVNSKTVNSYTLRCCKCHNQNHTQKNENIQKNVLIGHSEAYFRSA